MPTSVTVRVHTASGGWADESVECEMVEGFAVHPTLPAPGDTEPLGYAVTHPGTGRRLAWCRTVELAHTLARGLGELQLDWDFRSIKDAPPETKAGARDFLVAFVMQFPRDVYFKIAEAGKAA